tara:strand:+ start:129 stop:1727 length:1599 start_codon:yes stop_codon:yes gene_type:complete
MKINSIVVVGGGSAGWMTAAALSRFFSPEELEISLVESENVPKIGVGESTTAHFNEFVDIIGLPDKEWMPECNATYKNNIRFPDFRERGTSFEYPFGSGHRMEQVMLWAKAAAQYDLPPESFSEFLNPNTFLAKYNRQSLKDPKLQGYDPHWDQAYHFDTIAYGQFLKNKVCLPNGVKHYIDDVVGVEKDEDGYLTCVVGKSQKYSADLYIDCTGFKSLLLEKEMGVEFLSYKPWLSNDKAMSTHLPYLDKEEEMINSTTCTGIDNGWVWNVPIWDRMGTGYVYSSDFVDDDTAEMEFRRHLASDSRFVKRTEELEFRKIDIKHGIHKDGWINNVVAIGLSYGFVEPLESTSLISTYKSIVGLCNLLKKRNTKVNRLDRDGWNISTAHDMNGYRDFVAMHYATSSRDDTPYWKYHTEEKSWIGIDQSKFYPIHDDHSGTTFHDHFYAAIFAVQHYQLWTGQADGYEYIMAGQGYKPLSKHELNNNCKETPKQLEKVYEGYKRHVEKLTEHVLTKPSSYQFLKEHIYGLTDQQ